MAPVRLVLRPKTDQPDLLPVPFGEATDTAREVQIELLRQLVDP
jgi:hypothetical protein